MAVKLSDVLKDKQATTGVAPGISEYETNLTEARSGDLEVKRSESRENRRALLRPGNRFL